MVSLFLFGSFFMTILITKQLCDACDDEVESTTHDSKQIDYKTNIKFGTLALAVFLKYCSHDRIDEKFLANIELCSFKRQLSVSRKVSNIVS